MSARELGIVSLPTPEEYRQNAAECLRLAKETNDSASKVLLLEMAMVWIKLADQSHDKTRD